MVDATFVLVADQPNLSPLYRGLRRALVSRFPYAVFYRVDPDAVRVVAVLYSKMNLGRLSTRV